MSRLRFSGIGVSLTFDGPRKIPLYKPLHIRYGLSVHSDQTARRHREAVEEVRRLAVILRTG
ncbi:MAG: hypothetical protein KBE65_19655 [Phycisphaerae bacterium]|nr:hypothetical protein [Phycisphaerae bacterium]